MNQWLQKQFSNVKVQKQLFVTFLLAISLPILSIGLFLVVNTQRTLRSHYADQAAAENLRVRSVLFDVTTNSYNLSEDFATDPSLISLLCTHFTDRDLRFRSLEGYPLIGNMLARDTSLSSIRIYHENKTIGDYGSFRYLTEEDRKTDWYAKACDTPGSFWITKPRSDQYGNKYVELTMYRRIPLIKTNSFAILELAVSDNYLRNRIENTSLLSIASVNQDLVFYSSDRPLRGVPMPTPINYSLPYFEKNGRISVGEEPFLGAVITLQPYKSDDLIYIVSYSKDALPYLNRILVIYILLVLMALLLPWLLIYAFTRYFSARVNTLRSAMHQASSGDYDIIDSFQGTDELSETFQDLKVMIQEIQEKDAEMYEAQIREQQLENKQQQMEFKVLANQINPHFLYNTLETIRMKAFTSGNQEVATAIKLLGKSLRYVLENTGTASTTLERELSYIDIYMKIQRLRFGDRISYCLNVPSGLDLAQFHILPLLLQPIVENAISHGLDATEAGGRIILSVRAERDDYLHIEISDNGSGMDEEEKEELLRNLHTSDTARTRSIGLYNINQRIALCYGPEYGMTIRSRRGEGTTVALKLPQNKPMED